MATHPTDAEAASTRAIPRWVSLALAVAIVPAIAFALTFAWLGAPAAAAAGIGALAAAIVAAVLLANGDGRAESTDMGAAVMAYVASTMVYPRAIVGGDDKLVWANNA